MKSLIILLFTSICLVTNAHDAQIASFNLSSAGDHLKFRATFETHDLNEIWTDYEHFDNVTQEDLMRDYLLTRTKWYINQSEQELCNLTMSNNNRHSSIEGIIYLAPEQVMNIDIFNTCMIAEIPDHINLLNIELNDRLRSFRMDENRTSITVDY